jgi:hypothetical protein
MNDSIAYKMTPEQFLSQFEPKMEKFLLMVRTRKGSLNDLAVQCGFESYQQYLSHRRIYCDLNLIA